LTSPIDPSVAPLPRPAVAGVGSGWLLLAACGLLSVVQCCFMSLLNLPQHQRICSMGSPQCPILQLCVLKYPRSSLCYLCLFPPLRPNAEPVRAPLESRAQGCSPFLLSRSNSVRKGHEEKDMKRSQYGSISPSLALQHFSFRFFPLRIGYDPSVCNPKYSIKQFDSLSPPLLGIRPPHPARDVDPCFRGKVRIEEG